MQTVRVKLSRQQRVMLKDHAQRRGCSQGAVIRDLIEQHLGSNRRSSLHEQAKDLCGCLAGPRDLSTRPLHGYGCD